MPRFWVFAAVASGTSLGVVVWLACGDRLCLLREHAAAVNDLKAERNLLRFDNDRLQGQARDAEGRWVRALAAAEEWRSRVWYAEVKQANAEAELTTLRTLLDARRREEAANALVPRVGPAGVSVAPEDRIPPPGVPER